MELVLGFQGGILFLRNHLSTIEVTATATVDYETTNFEFSTNNGTTFQPAGGINGTEVTIPSGVNNIQIRIDTITDSDLEIDETFNLGVANVVSGTVGNITDTGIGTIADFNSASVSCPTPSVLIQGRPSRRSLYDLTNAIIDPGTPITGLDPGVTLNANGFNIIDRYFYGLEDVNGDKSLYRFDAFGNALKLGEIASLNFNRYNSGDIDLDGYYYVSNSGRTLIEVFDLNPNRSTYFTKIAQITSPVSLSSDLAISPIDNRIYFIRNNKDLWSLEIDLASQSVVNQNNFGPTNFSGRRVAIGAAFFDIDGNFYAYNNRSGDLLKFPTQPTVSTTGQSIGQGNIVNNNDGTRCSIAPVVPVLTTPELILVKRITAINGTTNTNGGQDLSIFNNDFNDLNDNNPNWPIPLNTFLKGGINGGTVRSGDEIEYTIYFLSSGAASVRNVKICDVIPVNSSFVVDAFGINNGIVLANSNTFLPINPTDILTNTVNDGDRGNFYPQFSQTPSVCKDPNNLTIPLTSSNNLNGAVVVNVVGDPAVLDNAITPGNPANSYGFIRFKVRVN